VIIAPDVGLTGAMPLEYRENLQGFDAVVLWADETALRMARSALAKRKGAFCH